MKQGQTIASNEQEHGKENQVRETKKEKKRKIICFLAISSQYTAVQKWFPVNSIHMTVM